MIYMEQDTIRISEYKQIIDVTKEEIKKCHEGFPALSNRDAMLGVISCANIAGDSIGASVECTVFGMPYGIGGSMFDGLEGQIAKFVYSIPAVKGIEFGYGFDLCEMLGSFANDPLRVVDGKVEITSNGAGGINGGISNGNPITLRVGFRPTPSISSKQKTVDLEKMENVEISIKGRHDSCVGVRAVPVVECAVAIALVDRILKEKDR